jgi:hypothetical protein
MPYQNLHLRSNVQGKEPVAGTATGQLPVGSIGINFNADEPFLTIQDSAGAIRRIAGLKVGTTAPATPTAGETWLDTTVSTKPVFKVHDGTAWQVAGGSGVTGGGTAPASPSEGDLWVDTSVSGSPVLMVYNGTSWAAVFPDAPDGLIDGTVQYSRQVVTAGGVQTKTWEPIAAAGTPDKIEEGNTSAEVIDTGTDGRFVVTTEGKEALRVDNQQRVGIGTTPSAAPLEIKCNSSYHNIALRGTDTGVLASERATIRAYNAAGINGFISWDNDTTTLGGSRDAPVLFSTNNAGVYNERMRVDSSGRLLVGTSSSSSNLYVGGGNITGKIQIAGSGAGYNTGLSLLNYDSAGACPILSIGTSLGSSIGSNVAVASGNDYGIINFVGNDGTNFRSGAQIRAVCDGSVSAGDLPTRLAFLTTPSGSAAPVERMRITSGGGLLAGATAPISIGGVSSVHNFVGDESSKWAAVVRNAASSTPYGLAISYYGASPNNIDSDFLYCIDSVAERAKIRSNGGLANFSANNVNLSDRNLKKDISLAAGTWDCLKAWEIVNYRYKDQPDDADLNMGVIAQQIAESCPEVITVFQAAKQATKGLPAQEERIGVKEQQMVWMAIKALQEAMERIEQLEAKVNTLEGN